MKNRDLFGETPEIAEKTAAPEKSAGALRTISEVAQSLTLPTHVLRFWETRFPEITPLKLRGGRRYYRPEDVLVLEKIKHLLYAEGYTIKGAQAAIKEVAAAPAARRASKQETAEAAAPHEAVDRVIEDISAGRKKDLQQILSELHQIRDMLKSCA